MNFKFLTGDMNWQTYGGKFVSKKLNNGDFDYWLVMDVINWHEATGDESPEKYCVEVMAIAPSELPQEELDSAWESCGYGESLEDSIKKYGDLFLVEMISSYMGGARIFSESGNNLKKLMKEAREQSDTMGNFLFGFAMDRYQNRIGSTGWDVLKGDITAGLYRNQEG